MLDVVGEADAEALGVGVLDVVGRGVEEAVGEGEVVGVADAVGVGVGVVVTEPVPGQVCDKRIPESEPLICAKVPA